jgi:hypothetical protein
MEISRSRNNGGTAANAGERSHRTQVPVVTFIMQNERELEVLKERTRLALPFMVATCAL